jgi:hypothetical protein
MATGLAVRLAHVLPAGFPLNDGMFYINGGGRAAGHYLLPDTSYNGLDIPFAYPPIAFFLAACLDAVGSWSLLDVIRFLPLVASVLTIPAFYLLARAMLSSRPVTMIATLAFAVLPRSFNWEIVGGGLTRSVGLLFALLALHQGYLLLKNSDARRILPTAVLAALSLMSHPETGWLVAFSGDLLPGLRRGLVSSGLSALVGNGGGQTQAGGSLSAWSVGRLVFLGGDSL